MLWVCLALEIDGSDSEASVLHCNAMKTEMMLIGGKANVFDGKHQPATTASALDYVNDKENKATAQGYFHNCLLC